MIKKNDIITIIEEAKFLYPFPTDSEFQIVSVDKNGIFARHLSKENHWGICELLPQTIIKKEMK